MNTTLILNATYEPMGIIEVKRAVNLTLAGKVDVLEEYDIPIRGATFEMKAPAVIRRREYKRIPHNAKVPLSRKSIFARDNYECQFTHCNRKAESIDHVHPRSKGGKNVWENVVASCDPCNSKKADKLMSKLGWKLKKEPVMPAQSAWLVQGPNTPELWLPYLPEAKR